MLNRDRINKLTAKNTEKRTKNAIKIIDKQIKARAKAGYYYTTIHGDDEVFNRGILREMAKVYKENGYEIVYNGFAGNNELSISWRD